MSRAEGRADEGPNEGGPMSAPASVQVSVTVEVDPATAFQVFTEEIGEWYQAGMRGLLGVERRRTLCLEPGVGGRLLEVGGPGGATEKGRVTVWEPGARLVFVDAKATEVDVSFEALDHVRTRPRTRVVLVHRGLDQLPDAEARSTSTHGWRRLAGWFEQHVAAGPDQRVP